MNSRKLSLQKTFITFIKKNNSFFYAVKFIALFIFIFIFSGFNFISEKNIIPKINDTIFVYDTVLVYDTIFMYDTIYLEEVVRDTIIKKIHIIKYTEKLPKDTVKLQFNSKKENVYRLSVDFLFSPSYSYRNFSSNYIYNEARLINKNATSSQIGYSYGFNINYYKKFATLTSGINYNQIRTNFKFLTIAYKTDSVDYYKYSTKTIIKIDSIPFINIDTLLLTGDTIYEYYLDTTKITKLDSVLSRKLDSIEYKYNDKNLNKFTYIEIPFIYSYNIHKKQYSISPEIGLIVGFIMNSQGKIVSLSNLKRSIEVHNETKLSSILLSLYLGMKFSYDLTSRTSIFTKVYYRQSINPIFENYPINLRYSTAGLYFGMNYKITK